MKRSGNNLHLGCRSSEVDEPCLLNFVVGKPPRSPRRAEDEG